MKQDLIIDVPRPSDLELGKRRRRRRWVGNPMQRDRVVQVESISHTSEVWAKREMADASAL